MNPFSLHLKPRSVASISNWQQSGKSSVRPTFIYLFYFFPRFLLCSEAHVSTRAHVRTRGRRALEKVQPAARDCARLWPRAHMC